MCVTKIDNFHYILFTQWYDSYNCPAAEDKYNVVATKMPSDIIPVIYKKRKINFKLFDADFKAVLKTFLGSLEARR